MSDSEDIANDPELGPLWKKLEELELPSAFDDADPDAPAEELVGDSIITTGGRGNARGAVVTTVSTKRKHPVVPKAVSQLQPRRWPWLALIVCALCLAWVASAYLRKPASEPSPSGSATATSSPPPVDDVNSPPSSAAPADSAPVSDAASSSTSVSTAVATPAPETTLQPSPQPAPTGAASAAPSADTSATPAVSTKRTIRRPLDPAPKPNPSLYPVFP